MPELNFSSNSIAVSGLANSQNYYFGLYEVEINLLHPNVSEVYFALQAPDGTWISLTEYFGSGANFVGTKFNVFASKSISFGSAPFSNHFMPVNNLADYQNGSDPNGSWTLFYYDNDGNGDVGILQNWSIKFGANPSEYFIDSFQTALPILKFNVPGAVPTSPKAASTLQVYNATANSISNTPTNTYFSGIELQGFTSAGANKPNFEFSLRTNTGASFNVPLLGLPAESDFILKGGVTDEWLMKDPLTFEFSRRLGYWAPRTKYVELFINNEYKGIYILMEKVKRGIDRVDISKLKTTDITQPDLSGGYIFEINPNGNAAAWYSNYAGYQGTNLASNPEFKMIYPKKDSIQPQQLDYIHSFVDSFEDATYGANFQDSLIGWRKYVNEKSVIDFLIVSEYSNNYDTYGRSTFFSKNKSTKGNKINFGPPWDSDRGYPNCTSCGWVHIQTHGLWVFPFWWNKFRTDTFFEKRLACRYNNARRYELTDSAVNNFIDGLDAQLLYARRREEIQWNKYFENKQTLKDRMIDRLNWMTINLQTVVNPPTPVVANSIYLGSSVNINIGNTYAYNFRPGIDSSYFMPPSVGNYTAIIQSKYGCETRKAFQVVLASPLSNLVVDLEARKSNNINILTWKYLEMNEAASLILQKSNNGIDYYTVFEENVTKPLKQFADAKTESVNFYRLQLVTKNGETLYSKIVALYQNDVNEASTVYPNPVHDQLFLKNSFVKKIEIFDLNGKCVLTESSNTFQIDVNTLTPGIYQIKQWFSDIDFSVEKIIKY